MSQSFPTKRAIWNRAILGGIVNAIKTAESESFACFEGWHRNHYLLNGVDGREGIITFGGGHWYPDAPVIAVFHDVHSDRFYSNQELDLERYFIGCPAYQRSLAEQAALSFLELEYEGRLLHRVTTAFWDEGEFVTAVDPWDTIVANGASLINKSTTEDLSHAMDEFAENYLMTDDQIALAKSLFERKIACPPAIIKLSMDEVAILESTFKDPKDQYAELDRLRTSWEKSKDENQETEEVKAKWWEAIDTKAEFEKSKSACREKFASWESSFLSATPNSPKMLGSFQPIGNHRHRANADSCCVEDGISNCWSNRNNWSFSCTDRRLIFSIN
jgi:hypothetical protein